MIYKTIKLIRTTLDDPEQIKEIKSTANFVAKWMTGELIFVIKDDYKFGIPNVLMEKLFKSFTFHENFITGKNIKAFIKTVKESDEFTNEDDLQSFNEFATTYENSMDDLFSDDTLFIFNYQ